jgi:hypothetical protein
MARAVGGGVDYWMELPLAELLKYLIELSDQLEQEKKALDEQTKRR